MHSYANWFIFWWMFQSKIFKFESSLGKVNEAYDSIASYKREVSNLFPRHQKALAKVKEHVECVEVQREQYKQVRYGRLISLCLMLICVCVCVRAHVCVHAYICTCACMYACICLEKAPISI